LSKEISKQSWEFDLNQNLLQVGKCVIKLRKNKRVNATWGLIIVATNFSHFIFRNIDIKMIIVIIASSQL